MKMREKYVGDRPREKLRARGAGALSNAELLQAIVGSGNAQADVVTIARRVLDVVEDKGVGVSYEDLSRVGGLGASKICMILAAFELAGRYMRVGERPLITSPEDVVGMLEGFKRKAQEHLILFTLDGANRLIRRHVVSVGTLTASLVHPREIFAPAIEDRAAGIILAHNHPSGDLTASAADRECTERVRKVGEVVGIPLTDHVVVSRNGWRSIL